MEDLHRRLTESDSQINDLENRLKKVRSDVLAAYKYQSSSPSQRLFAKATYAGFAAALNEATANFNQLVEVFLDVSYNAMSNHSSHPQEIVDKSECSSLSGTGTPTDSNQMDLYKNSVPITDELSMDDSSRKAPTLHSAPHPVAPVAPVPPVGPVGPVERTEAVEAVEDLKYAEHAEPVNVTGQYVETAQVTHTAQHTEEPHTVQIEIPEDAEYKTKATATVRRSGWCGIAANETVSHRPMTRTRTTKVACHYIDNKRDYKYNGKAFDTLYKGKPIYSTTTLFCKQTCNEDADQLKQFMAKHGGFDMKIIDIDWRGRFCLIKVRGSLEHIQDRIDQLNHSLKRKVMHIYRKNMYVRPASQRTNVLFVNNFDILSQRTHRKMTSLFLRYGDLVKDIEMHLDKEGNPFALVFFKYVEDAQTCCSAADIIFDGKYLDIQYRLKRNDKKKEKKEKKVEKAKKGKKSNRN